MKGAVSPSNHSNRHFLGAQLATICATDISTATSFICKEINLNHPRDSDASKPGHPTCSVQSSGNQTAATQRTTDFLHSCWWPFNNPGLQTAYFHTDLDKALQPTISCFCHRQRKSTQHIRTLKLLWKSTVSDELPTDWHTAAILTAELATICCLSFIHHGSARTLAASQASTFPAVSWPQAAAAVEPLHLPTIGSFQDHCCKTFKGPFQHHPNLPKAIYQLYV